MRCRGLVALLFFASCGCSSAPAAGGGSQGSHATSGDVRALDVRLEKIRERLDLLSADDWAFWKMAQPCENSGCTFTECSGTAAACAGLNVMQCAMQPGCSIM